MYCPEFSEKARKNRIGNPADAFQFICIVRSGIPCPAPSIYLCKAPASFPLYAFLRKSSSATAASCRPAVYKPYTCMTVYIITHHVRFVNSYFIFYAYTFKVFCRKNTYYDEFSRLLYTNRHNYSHRKFSKNEFFSDRRSPVPNKIGINPNLSFRRKNDHTKLYPAPFRCRPGPFPQVPAFSGKTPSPHG